MLGARHASGFRPFLQLQIVRYDKVFDRRHWLSRVGPDRFLSLLQPLHFQRQHVIELDRKNIEIHERLGVVAQLAFIRELQNSIMRRSPRKVRLDLRVHHLCILRDKFSQSLGISDDLCHEGLLPLWQLA